jgi:ABC-type phosphate transport system auxiliary subunit
VTAGLAVALSVMILALVSVVVFGLTMWKNAKVLATSMKEFQEAVQPIVDDIQREATLASEHAERLQEALPSKEPGAKIRR